MDKKKEKKERKSEEDYDQWGSPSFWPNEWENSRALEGILSIIPPEGLQMEVASSPCIPPPPLSSLLSFGRIPSLVGIIHFVNCPPAHLFPNCKNGQKPCFVGIGDETNQPVGISLIRGSLPSAVLSQESVGKVFWCRDVKFPRRENRTIRVLAWNSECGVVDLDDAIKGDWPGAKNELDEFVAIQRVALWWSQKKTELLMEKGKEKKSVEDEGELVKMSSDEKKTELLNEGEVENLVEYMVAECGGKMDEVSHLFREYLSFFSSPVCDDGDGSLDVSDPYVAFKKVP